MKKILLLLAVILTAAIGAYSQAPGIFNYQGVARNSVGNVLINQSIALRLTIHDGTTGGPVVYQEVRGVTTNPFGLFNAQVGSAGATSVTGTIAGVPWSVGNKFIQVEIDPNGGSSFINIGTAQIASVPYSLYTSVSGLSADLVLPFNKTQADAGTLFKITNSGAGAGSTSLEGLTNSLAANVSAIIGTVTTASAGSFSAGVKGINNGNAGLGIGVWGTQNGSGWGVYGVTPSGLGVFGSSTSGTGVQGSSTSGNGVNGSSSSAIGVFGTSNTSNAGVFTNSNAANGSDALQASTNGTGTSWAIRATSTGLQGAGIFQYNNGTGAANALRVLTNGTGFAANISSSNATPKALLTTGGLQHTGINEALNRVLASDATGNATWQDLGAIGGVTGSGTVNFVPKWTPIGTNLGNSQIFDNGISVGINTATPNAAYRLEVNGIQRINLTSVQEGGELRFQEGTLFGAPNQWIIDNFESFAGGNKFRIWNDVGGMNIQMLPNNKTAIGPMVFSDQPQSILDVEGNLAVGAAYSGTTAAPVDGAIIQGNVGIGTNAPTARLHVVGLGTNNFAVAGIGTQPGAVFTQTLAGQARQSGLVGYGEGGTIENDGVIGVTGGSATSFNIAGGFFARINNANPQYGIYAESITGSNPGNRAGWFIGKVQIQDGTQANNFILRSDATGTANWTNPATLLGPMFWSTTGNAGTVDGTNFIGTTDNVPFNVRVNNQKAGRIDQFNGNTGWGYLALNSNTTGAENHGFGYATLAANTTGNFNTAIGTFALTANTTAEQNDAVGVQALSANTTGVRNDAFGVGTLQSNTTGIANTAAGNFALYQSTTGNFNTGIGRFALSNNTTGSNNTAIGLNSLIGNTIGTNNTALGAGANVSVNNLTNATAIGANAVVSASNSLVLGNNANVGIGTPSPVALLHVENTAVGEGGVRVYQPNENNIPGLKSLSGGAIGLDISGFGTPWGSNSIFAQRGDFTVGTISKINAQDAIYGTGTGANIALEGSAQNGIAVAGVINGTGTALAGIVAGGGGSALKTTGSVQMQGIGEANNYVLTSDAAGNATWQNQSIGISAHFLTAPIVVPPNVFTPITQWTNITEDGGANYNPLTGSYTITKAGVYQVNAGVVFDALTSNASITLITLAVNAVNSHQGNDYNITAGNFSSPKLAIAQRFNVGDVLTISILQNSAVNQTIGSGYFADQFSVQLIHY